VEIPVVGPERYRELIGSAGVQVLVADEDGELAGYMTVGWSRDDDAPAAVGEVRTCFVHPDSWRTKVGTALMDEGLRRLRDEGYEQATVWSFDANDRANAFYERHGFRRDGAGRRTDVWGRVLEVRYRRPLGGG
jgi:GNAT superfamily N-acetyltransferase